MKHVKRILVSLGSGIFLGFLMGFLYHLQGSETWLKDAFWAGWFYGLGCWLGTGIKFVHKK